MADEWQLVLLDEAKDGARVLACAEAARDYILLETGREPDATWVQGVFGDVPPGRTRKDILMFGVERADGALIGLLGTAPGYETASEWYIGLLLIREAARGDGVGTTVLREVVTLAKTSGAQTLKVAVLENNPGGLRFWQRHGFTHFRDAPDGGDGDGHDRVVLQRQL